MVEKKGCRDGGAFAGNGFHQMTGTQSDSKYDGGHEFLDSTMKDLCSGKELRKISTAWKLLVLVVIGAIGSYMCMVGVGTKQFPYEAVEETAIENWRREDESCAQRGSSVDYYQHYPLPHSHGRQECQCTPVHYFVILSMQRSGSGWFETLLNNHQNISSHGEIFSVKERRANFSSIARTMDKIYNLDWLNSAAKNECTAAVGFKWMLNQGAMEYNREVSGYFEKMGVSVVLLLRRNVLKRLISILANAYDRKVKPLNGVHKSHVHSVEEAMKLAEYRPVLDVNRLIDNLHRVEQITDDAQRFFNNTRLRVVYYEDLVMDPKHLMQVQEFLGVQPRKLESLQVKIHTRPLREQIQNWDAVQAHLRGTQYEALLLDGDSA